MNGCVFCRIIKRVAPASIVYSDERVVAFMDIQPVNPGHVLLVPIVHVARLCEFDPETGGHMFMIAMQIAEALKNSSLRCEGINLLLADGEAASQEIFHVHLHVIPRWRDDGFGFKFGPDYGTRPSRKTLDENAEEIKASMPTSG